MYKEIWKDVPDYEGYYQVSNLSNAHIVQVLKGQRLSHKGYTFEYIR